MPSAYKKVLKGEFKGWIKEDVLSLLPPAFFQDPISSIRGMEGVVVKESKYRWAAIFSLANGRRIFFKRDRTKGWIESLKFFFLSSRGRREWILAYQFQQKCLNIPLPLGWMEKVRHGFVRESCYFSEAVGSGVSSLEDAVESGDSLSIMELAEAVKKIHREGLFHKDLHGGNFLREGGSFFLIDLHRARIVGRLSLSQRLQNLSELIHSLRSIWGEEERLRFVEKYFEGESLSLQEKEKRLQKIHSLMDSLQKRQWQSRTKRCIKESTEFSVKKEGDTRFYFRRDFTLDLLRKKMKEHLQLAQEKPSALVKESPEVAVSILKGGKVGLCVKQYRSAHVWDGLRENFRRSKGLKAWINANGLRARGVPCLNPLAFAEKRNGLRWRESFFLMEVWERGREMDRYILRGFQCFEEKRLFIKAFARWLSYLHGRDVYHQDMKTCNILVSENGKAWDFRLLDLEDVVLDKKVSEKRVFKNLLQLNTSIPRSFTRTDRLRFLKEYSRLLPMIKNEKVFLSQLIQKSKKRGVVFVSPQGVVEERYLE